MSTLNQPFERIDIRTSPEIKALIVRAASTTGVSLSAFLIACAQERARQVLAETETLTFSPRDWDAFFSALDNADKPRPKLEAAAQDYLKWRDQSTPARLLAGDRLRRPD